MQQRQVTNQKEADIFFYCRGAMGFFDSYCPKFHHEDDPVMFRRNYFNIDNHQIGWYCPVMWQTPHLALKFFEDFAPWGKHPKLTNLAVDLENWLHRRNRNENLSV